MSILSRRIGETAPMSVNLAELQRKYPDLINLSIGDTDFTTDPRIIRAAFRDAENGYTHYGDVTVNGISSVFLLFYTDEHIIFDI